jgi:hypothetical protein
MDRWTRIFAAFFWFFWAGVIVPGHTRGVIQLDGKEARSNCCHVSSRSAPDGSPKSPLPASKNCAICFVAAKLSDQSLPAPAALKLPFAYRAFVPKVAEAPAIELILPFHTRGPPDSSTANT